MNSNQLSSALVALAAFAIAAVVLTLALNSAALACFAVAASALMLSIAMTDYAPRGDYRTPLPASAANSAVAAAQAMSPLRLAA